MTTTQFANNKENVSEHVQSNTLTEISESISTLQVANNKEKHMEEPPVKQAKISESTAIAHLAIIKDVTVSQHEQQQSVLKSTAASTTTFAAPPRDCSSNNTHARNLSQSITIKSDVSQKSPFSHISTQLPGSGPCTDKQAAPSVGSENADQKSGGVKSSYGAGKPYFGMVFVRPGETLPAKSVPSGASLRLGNSKAAQSANKKKGPNKTPTPVVTFPPTPEAKPILSKEEYLAAWKNEKDVQLKKLKKLAYEVVALKTTRPNAKDKLHSAANRVPVRVEYNTEPVVVLKSNNTYLCYVFVDRVSVASGRGLKIKEAKTNAYEAALQKILMPHIRINKIDPESSELEGSKEPFVSPPPEPSEVPLPKSAAKVPPSAVVAPPKTNTIREIPSQQKESNRVSACLKRRLDEQKPLEDFVIVEPLVPVPDCTPAHTLRRSADFNHMLLEYEYFFKGDAARCVVKIENNVLADINAPSKMAAKNKAATKALQKLKDICWVIKTKAEVDSHNKICKEDMLNELYDQSEVGIEEDNVGNRLLRKMGWYGGGVGKHGSGIVEPVSMSTVLNREGLGLSAKKEITEAYKKQVRQVIENYAASGNQEDLVFSYLEFRLEERQVIHDECRRLNLNSKCRSKGRKKFLCVSRKRTASELFDHVMVSGGETARYFLVPPGFDDDTESQLASKEAASSKAASTDGTDGKKDVKDSSAKNTGKGLLPSPGLLGDAPLPAPGLMNNCLHPPAFNNPALAPLQGNPLRPFVGSRFGCPRPEGFRHPPPGLWNRMGHPRMRSIKGNNSVPCMQNRLIYPRMGVNMGNMHFPIGNGINEEYGNNHGHWGPQQSNECFQDFAGHDNSSDNGEMEFNGMNHFHNGEMGPPELPPSGFRSDLTMGNQHGAQNNSGCFQNYDKKNNGFHSERGMRFSGLGKNEDVDDQWGDSNNGFQGEYHCNSGFQNEGMHLPGFSGRGNVQRGGGNNHGDHWSRGNNQGKRWNGMNHFGNQWDAENNQRNEWGGGNNEGNQWDGGNNRGNQWDEGSNQGNQWNGGNNQGNQWGEEANQGNQWGEEANQGNQWGEEANQGNQWAEEADQGNQWGEEANQGNQWGEEANQGNQWGEEADQGNQWAEEADQGNQWGGENTQGNHWGGGINQGNQWDGENQGNQWGRINNLGNKWDGENNPDNQWELQGNNACFQNVSDHRGGFQHWKMRMRGRGFGKMNNTFKEIQDAGGIHIMEDKRGSRYFHNRGSYQNKRFYKHMRGRGRGFGQRGMGETNMGRGQREKGLLPKGPNKGGCEQELIVNGGDDGGPPLSEPVRQPAGVNGSRDLKNCIGGTKGNMQQNVEHFHGNTVPVKGEDRQQSSGSQGVGPLQTQEVGTVR
ncbi:hypothetical protein BsWGS_08892 [Bradybaena similaris]